MLALVVDLKGGQAQGLRGPCPSAHLYSKINLSRPRFDHLLYEVFSRYVLKNPLEKLNLWKHIIQFALTTLEANRASPAYR